MKPEVSANVSQVVAAYLQNNKIDPGQLGALIDEVKAKFNGEDVEPAKPLNPAIAINKSVTPDYIICLEDGAKLKTLKRHLSHKFGLTCDEYRTKWGLAADYPMVAPNYSRARSTLATAAGLGKKKS